MQWRRFKRPRLLREDQIQSLIEFARDERVKTSIASLMDMPEEGDNAMTDPAVWLATQGVEVPEGFSAVITKDISISKPVDPASLGVPGPHWIPYDLRFTSCRTYVVATKDGEGKTTGYHTETVCLGIEVVGSRQLGPL